jgi:hypothetical protein
MLEKKGLTWQQCTVPDGMRGPCYELLPMRERKTLGFKLLVDPDAKSVDVGQTVDRSSVGRLDDKGNMLLPTLTPGSKTWLVDQQRTLHSSNVLKQLWLLFLRLVLLLLLLLFLLLFLLL